MTKINFTNNLKLILKELNEKPLSVRAIQKKLPEINKSVIYRTVNKLINNGEISEIISSDGEIMYELRNDHHHHIICKICNKTFCIELPTYLSDSINKFEEEISNNFSRIVHRIDFFMECSECIKI